MQQTNTLYSLQLLRFIAAILVLLFHLEMSKSGYKGVDVFFVISGFVMYYTTIILKPKNLLSFFINRTTKIFFLYWIAMISLYMVNPFKINFSFINTLLLIPGHNSILGISWSLSYELYFYFLYGLIFYLIPEKYYCKIFILLFVTTSIITILNTTQLTIKGTFLNFLLGQNLWEFISGILSAHISIKIINKINPVIALLISMISLLLLISINIPYLNVYSYIVYGTLAFIIILFITMYEFQIPLNKKISALFKIFGDSSYAIYLFGPVITNLILPNNLVSKLIVITLTVTFAVLINQLVENNSLKIIRSVLTKKLKILQ